MVTKEVHFMRSAMSVRMYISWGGALSVGNYTSRSGAVSVRKYTSWVSAVYVRSKFIEWCSVWKEVHFIG